MGRVCNAHPNFLTLNYKITGQKNKCYCALHPELSSGRCHETYKAGTTHKNARRPHQAAIDQGEADPSLLWNVRLSSRRFIQRPARLQRSSHDSVTAESQAHAGKWKQTESSILTCSCHSLRSASVLTARVAEAAAQGAQCQKVARGKQLPPCTGHSALLARADPAAIVAGRKVSAASQRVRNLGMQV